MNSQKPTRKGQKLARKRLPRNPHHPRSSRSKATSTEIRAAKRSKQKSQHPNPLKRHSCREKPVLRFTPTAWAKLQYFCHAGETEIGGFGLSHPEDPLLVVDFLTVKQATSSVTVDFDDHAVADLFEEQVLLGRQPEQFGRIWCHTHPGSSAHPSGTDEETFARAFGNCDWAVMFILAKGGETYCRLRFNVGPGGDGEIDTQIDYGHEFAGADHAAWQAEYEAHVFPADDEGPTGLGLGADAAGGYWQMNQLDELEELEELEPDPMDDTGGYEALADLDEDEEVRQARLAQLMDRYWRQEEEEGVSV